MAFRGLQIPFKARKKGLKNDDITSFSYSFYDFKKPRADASKRTGFYGKIYIKACLEIEKTQAVCCGHLQNICFTLNSNTIIHCAKSGL